MWTAITSFYSEWTDWVPAPLGKVFFIGLASAALVIWFFRTQLQLKTSRTTPVRAWGGLAFAILICVWAWLIFFSAPWIFLSNPWILDYPLPQWVGPALVVIFPLALGLTWFFYFLAVEDGSKKFWLKVLTAHENVYLCLLELCKAQKNTFQLHMRWRFELWGDVVAEGWREGQIKRWLLRQRWLWVVLAGGATITLLVWVLDWLNPSNTLQEVLRHALFPSKADDDAHYNNSAGAWTVFSAFVAAPIAYVLWWFRDTNQLWLIDNNRKDTNLKDFQQLCEWASGEHLVEVEVSDTQIQEANKVSTSLTTKRSVPPQSTLGTSLPSRRDGGEALQLAAIYQLHRYLLGEFGPQFQKPTLTLFMALWARLTSVLLGACADIKNGKTLADTSGARLYLKATSGPGHTALGLVVQHALLTNGGAALRQFHSVLPGAMLLGINVELPGLDGLRLDHLSLRGVNLAGAGLRDAKLQGADLQAAQLQGAHLANTQLQNSILSAATLVGTLLFSSQLQGACLYGADLRKAYLRDAQLQGANLCQAKLQATRFINIGIDTLTVFQDSLTDAQTLVSVRILGEMGCNPNGLLTHALRLKLRDINGLTLPDCAYEEFKPQWDALNVDEREKIYNKAYEYSAHPDTFVQDFPLLGAHT